MNTKKTNIKNSKKILEKNNTSKEGSLQKNTTEIKTNENILSNKASINTRTEIKNKKRQKIKIRAYCNKCYQFFENGPYSKICRNHLEKECNLIECQKLDKNGDNPCIRKFTNINSANRHTHCLTKKDIEMWDKKYEIQKCLGKKKEPDNKFLDVINNLDNDNHEKNTYKNFFSDINNNNSHNNSFNLNNNNLFLDNNNSFFDNSSENYFSNNNVIGLIEDIDKLHFNDKETNNKEVIKNNFYKPDLSEKKGGKEEKDNKIEDIKEKEHNNENFEKLSIEEFFDKVQNETNIQNNIKKKLINAFKKKGILNVKILILFYKKHKNWDFLIEKFKKVTSQIEGVALCIEFLLKVH